MTGSVPAPVAPAPLSGPHKSIKAAVSRWGVDEYLLRDSGGRGIEVVATAGELSIVRANAATWSKCALVVKRAGKVFIGPGFDCGRFVSDEELTLSDVVIDGGTVRFATTFEQFEGKARRPVGTPVQQTFQLDCDLTTATPRCTPPPEPEICGC